MTSQPALVADIWQHLLGAGAIVVGAIANLCALRNAKFPFGGRAVIAGAIAGILLGPTVMGRVFPQQFNSMFGGGGGAIERADLEFSRRLTTGAPIPIEGLSPDESTVISEQAAAEIARKQAALDAVRWRHQAPLRWLATGSVVIVMLGAARRTAGERDRRQGFITPLSVGIWSFAIPAAAAYICAMRWWETSIAEAAMLAAAVGIGPWVLGEIDREAADGAEFGGARMMQAAGRIASSLAIGLAMWAAWTSRGWSGAISIMPLLALPIAWLIATRTSVAATQNHDASADRQQMCDAWIIEPALATLAATVSLHVDLHAQLDWTMLAMIILLSLFADDGRLIGGLVGALLPGGRPLLRTMRLVMPAMTAGPTQLAIAALAIQCRLLPERFAIPLLTGVLLIELTAPARRNMARRLIEVENEFNEE